MKVSYSWLKQYIDIDMDPNRVSEWLTGCGLEVEGMETYETIRGGLRGLVIGKVLTCVPHVNSDHLHVTTVDVGGEQPLPIVCGAPNIAQGQTVVVATVGTQLYSGEESFIIKKSKIRGEQSMGMICSEQEIGLGVSHDGIMTLTDDVEVGTLAKDFFNVQEDTVFEIGLTPNRSDAASIVGTARDLVAVLRNKLNEPLTHLELKLPSVDDFSPDNQNLPVAVVVEDVDACIRYSGVTIQGVVVKESPDWLKHRLEAVGLRSVNNVVDATNFVLFELGQPLHAFDVAKIAGNKIVVRKMPEGTAFTTLDDVERKLSANDLMICNEKEGMCIAGVFGGNQSGVTAQTTDVFIESACFDPVSVRKTSKYHGIKTDASFRFERGTDANITVYALKRAALLIKEIAGGTIASNVVDVYPRMVEPILIRVNYNRVNRLIGKIIPEHTVIGILSDLEFKIVEQDEDGLLVGAPTNKVDVTREADVVEEILRVYGYNNVEIPLSVNASLSYSPKPNPETIRNQVSDLLTYNGFAEAMSNSLTSVSYSALIPEFDAQSNVQLLNPLSRELNIMRRTLVFGGLEAVAYNINRQSQNLKLYEFGNVYHMPLGVDATESVEKRYVQQQRLALFITGKIMPEAWNTSPESVNFFHLKNYVINILSRLGIQNADLVLKPTNSELYSEGLCIFKGEKNLAVMGSISRKVLRHFDIGQPVLVGELMWDEILKLAAKNRIHAQSIPKFPGVRRDLALLVDNTVTYQQIETIAIQQGKKLLKAVNLFDVYEGDKLEAGKKSYAISLMLQDEKSTLKDKEVEKLVQRVVTTLQNELGATLR